MMDVVTIDTETFYDKDYSLTKMSTEAYIRDPRFEVIGVGVKVNDNPTDWYSGEEPGRFLKSLDYSKRAILCHNTAFDGAILHWHFGIRPRLWLDTLSMARPFHRVTVGGSLAKLAEHYKLGVKGNEVIHALGKRRRDFEQAELARYGMYCVNDVDLTKALFDKLKIRFPVDELFVIDQVLRMFIEPSIELDVPLLKTHLAEVREGKEKLLAGIEVEASDVMSNPKFAAALQRLGVAPPTKISLTTGKETWAFAKTDSGMTDLLEHPDERVQAMAAARLGVKSTLEETRTESFIGVAKRGRLPILLNYYGAHTGRLSGGDGANLQNLPSRGNTTIRRALKAPEGHLLISCDSSQIEARLVAWLAGQDDLVTSFREGRDVYCEFASEIYGRPITKADKVERFVGKVAILSLGYGAGAAKFRDMLRIQAKIEIDEQEAERIVRLYRTKNFRISQLWNRCGHALTNMVFRGNGHIHEVLPYNGDGIGLPSGFRITYPALRQNTNGFEYLSDARQYRRYSAGETEGLNWVKLYGGKVVENCIAGGTEVLTHRGWIAVELVHPDDLVHDGVEFVQHGGVVYKSVQPCVMVDGVWMTPDHEVLTDDGWKVASQNPTPYRPDLRGIDCGKPGAQRWEETLLEVPVPVREPLCQGRHRGEERGEAWRNAELRLRDGALDRQEKQHSRHEQASGIRGVAFDGGQMHAANAPSVDELWWAWHHCVRTVETKFRELLARYGRGVRSWVGSGPRRQQRAVLTAELPMGNAPHEHAQQAKLVERGHNGDPLTYGHTALDAVLPTTERPVFDILNAGPRQRFVVRGDIGAFVVHNCTQALAAVVIRQQMVAAGSAGLKVVLQVHDEIVVCVPEDNALADQARLEEIMSTPPKWAPDLPVACESGVASNYGDT